MTRHRTILYSHCADVGNGYNYLRNINNIHLNMNAKPSMLEEFEGVVVFALIDLHDPQQHWI